MSRGRTVLVFLKHPTAGCVKTRLAETIGPQRAADLYREWIGIVFEKLQPLRATTRVVGFFDGAACEPFACWHAFADAWWPQPVGDLGHRLAAGFTMAFDGG